LQITELEKAWKIINVGQRSE